MLVLYTDICTPCKYKVQMNHLRHAARQRGTDVKVLEVKYHPEWLEEARQLSALALPFVYDTEAKISVSLKNIRTEMPL